MLQEHLSVSATLGEFTGKEAFLLLCIDARDKTLLRLEVEGHRITLILVATHLEHRSAFQFMGRRIHLTRSMYKIAVQNHVDLLTGQIHVLVFHL